MGGHPLIANKHFSIAELIKILTPCELKVGLITIAVIILGAS
jgi:hypothetical protein